MIAVVLLSRLDVAPGDTYEHKGKPYRVLRVKQPCRSFYDGPATGQRKGHYVVGGELQLEEIT